MNSLVIKKSPTLLLILTLLLGVIVGSLATGSFVYYRLHKIVAMTTPEGLEAFLLQHIEPDSVQQRASIRAVATKTSQELLNSSLESRQSILLAMDNLQRQLKPALTEEQFERLANAIQVREEKMPFRDAIPAKE